MQTYHKHGMGEVITLVFEVMSNGQGVTGQSPVTAVRKKSNGQWLDDAKTAWQAGYNDIAMAEADATNLPGVYTLDITHIDLTSEEYQVYFKNTGAYAGIDFESHIFTGAVYVPPSSSYSTGTVRGLLNIAMNKDGNNTFDQTTDSLEAQKDADETVDLTPVTNAIAALQIDLGDPSVDATSIYAQLLLIKGYVDTLEAALATHEANRATMQATLVAEHDATQAAIALIPVNPVNVISVTSSGSIVVSAVKVGGTFQFVRGNEISYPYGPLGKDVTGRKIYFAVKKKVSDTAYIIGFTDITANLTSVTTFTGLIPFTAAMTKDLAVGKYYLAINSYASDDTTFVKPLTEVTFGLDLVDRVINNP